MDFSKCKKKHSSSSNSNKKKKKRKKGRCQSVDKSPHGSPRRSPDRSPRNSPDRSPRICSDRSPRISPDRSLREYCDRSPRNSPYQSPRRSPNRSPSKSPDQSPRKSSNRSKREERKSPDRSLKKCSNRSPKKHLDLRKNFPDQSPRNSRHLLSRDASDRLPRKCCDGSPGNYPDQSPRMSADRSPRKCCDRSPGDSPDRSPRNSPDQSLRKYSDRSPRDSPDRSPRKSSSPSRSPCGHRENKQTRSEKKQSSKERSKSRSAPNAQERKKHSRGRQRDPYKCNKKNSSTSTKKRKKKKKGRCDSGDKSPDRSIDSSPRNSPDRSPRKCSDRSPRKCSDRLPEESPCQSPKRSPDSSPRKSPDQSPRICYDQSPRNSPDRSPNKCPDVSPTNSADESPYRRPQVDQIRPENKSYRSPNTQKPKKDKTMLRMPPCGDPNHSETCHCYRDKSPKQSEHEKKPKHKKDRYQSPSDSAQSTCANNDRRQKTSKKSSSKEKKRSKQSSCITVNKHPGICCAVPAKKQNWRGRCKGSKNDRKQTRPKKNKTKEKKNLQPSYSYYSLSQQSPSRRNLTVHAGEEPDPRVYTRNRSISSELCGHIEPSSRPDQTCEKRHLTSEYRSSAETLQRVEMVNKIKMLASRHGKTSSKHKEDPCRKRNTPKKVVCTKRKAPCCDAVKSHEKPIKPVCCKSPKKDVCKTPKETKKPYVSSSSSEITPPPDIKPKPCTEIKRKHSCKKDDPKPREVKQEAPYESFSSSEDTPPPAPKHRPEEKQYRKQPCKTDEPKPVKAKVYKQDEPSLERSSSSEVILSPPPKHRSEDRLPRKQSCKRDDSMVKPKPRQEVLPHESSSSSEDTPSAKYRSEDKKLGKKTYQREVKKREEPLPEHSSSSDVIPCPTTKYRAEDKQYRSPKKETTKPYNTKNRKVLEDVEDTPTSSDTALFVKVKPNNDRFKTRISKIEKEISPSIIYSSSDITPPPEEKKYLKKTYHSERNEDYRRKSKPKYYEDEEFSPPPSPPHRKSEQCTETSRRRPKKEFTYEEEDISPVVTPPDYRRPKTCCQVYSSTNNLLDKDYRHKPYINRNCTEDHKYDLEIKPSRQRHSDKKRRLTQRRSECYDDEPKDLERKPSCPVIMKVKEKERLKHRREICDEDEDYQIKEKRRSKQKRISQNEERDTIEEARASRCDEKRQSTRRKSKYCDDDEPNKDIECEPPSPEKSRVIEKERTKQTKMYPDEDRDKIEVTKRRQTNERQHLTRRKPKYCSNYDLNKDLECEPASPEKSRPIEKERLKHKRIYQDDRDYLEVTRQRQTDKTRHSTQRKPKYCDDDEPKRDEESRSPSPEILKDIEKKRFNQKRVCQDGNRDKIETARRRQTDEMRQLTRRKPKYCRDDEPNIELENERPYPEKSRVRERERSKPKEISQDDRDKIEATRRRQSYEKRQSAKRKSKYCDDDQPKSDEECEPRSPVLTRVKCKEKEPPKCQKIEHDEIKCKHHEHRYQTETGHKGNIPDEEVPRISKPYDRKKYDKCSKQKSDTYESKERCHPRTPVQKTSQHLCQKDNEKERPKCRRTEHDEITYQTETDHDRNIPDEKVLRTRSYYEVEQCDEDIYYKGNTYETKEQKFQPQHPAQPSQPQEEKILYDMENIKRVFNQERMARPKSPPRTRSPDIEQNREICSPKKNCSQSCDLNICDKYLNTEIEEQKVEVAQPLQPQEETKLGDKEKKKMERKYKKDEKKLKKEEKKELKKKYDKDKTLKGPIESSKIACGQAGFKCWGNDCLADCPRYNSQAPPAKGPPAPPPPPPPPSLYPAASQRLTQTYSMPPPPPTPYAKKSEKKLKKCKKKEEARENKLKKKDNMTPGCPETCPGIQSEKCKKSLWRLIKKDKSKSNIVELHPPRRFEAKPRVELPPYQKPPPSHKPYDESPQFSTKKSRSPELRQVSPSPSEEKHGLLPNDESDRPHQSESKPDKQQRKYLSRKKSYDRQSRHPQYEPEPSRPRYDLHGQPLQEPYDPYQKRRDLPPRQKDPQHRQQHNDEHKPQPSEQQYDLPNEPQQCYDPYDQIHPYDPYQRNHDSPPRRRDPIQQRKHHDASGRPESEPHPNQPPHHQQTNEPQLLYDPYDPSQRKPYDPSLQQRRHDSPPRQKSHDSTYRTKHQDASSRHEYYEPQSSQPQNEAPPLETPREPASQQQLYEPAPRDRNYRHTPHQPHYEPSQYQNVFDPQKTSTLADAPRPAREAPAACFCKPPPLAAGQVGSSPLQASNLQKPYPQAVPCPRLVMYPRTMSYPQPALYPQPYPVSYPQPMQNPQPIPYSQPEQYPQPELYSQPVPCPQPVLSVNYPDSNDSLRDMFVPKQSQLPGCSVNPLENIGHRYKHGNKYSDVNGPPTPQPLRVGVFYPNSSPSSTTSSSPSTSSSSPTSSSSSTLTRTIQLICSPPPKHKKHKKHKKHRSKSKKSKSKSKKSKKRSKSKKRKQNKKVREGGILVISSEEFSSSETESCEEPSTPPIRQKVSTTPSNELQPFPRRRSSCGSCSKYGARRSSVDRKGTPSKFSNKTSRSSYNDSIKNTNSLTVNSVKAKRQDKFFKLPPRIRRCGHLTEAEKEQKLRKELEKKSKAHSAKSSGSQRSMKRKTKISSLMNAKFDPATYPFPVRQSGCSNKKEKPSKKHRKETRSKKSEISWGPSIVTPSYVTMGESKTTIKIRRPKSSKHSDISQLRSRSTMDEGCRNCNAMCSQISLNVMKNIQKNSRTPSNSFIGNTTHVSLCEIPHGQKYTSPARSSSKRSRKSVHLPETTLMGPNLRPSPTNQVAPVLLKSQTMPSEKHQNAKKYSNASTEKKPIRTVYLKLPNMEVDEAEKQPKQDEEEVLIKSQFLESFAELRNRSVRKFPFIKKLAKLRKH